MYQYLFLSVLNVSYLLFLNVFVIVKNRLFTFRNTQFNILLNMWQNSLISPLYKAVYPCTFLIYLTFSCEMIFCLDQINPASPQGNSKAHSKLHNSMHRNFRVQQDEKIRLAIMILYLWKGLIFFNESESCMVYSTVAWRWHPQVSFRIYFNEKSYNWKIYLGKN